MYVYTEISYGNTVAKTANINVKSFPFSFNLSQGRLNDNDKTAKNHY